MDPEQIYTSTGTKLLLHGQAIEDLRNGKNHPITLHVMTTEVCNLECVFCSVAQRGSQGKWLPDLSMDQIRCVVMELIPLGLKAVILSGGGDPTIYPQINELIDWLHLAHLEIGMITNGILLSKRIRPATLRKLAWVRISANTFDYREEIEIPRIPETTTLGMSYVWNPLTTEKIINKVKQYVVGHRVKYVRVLSDCQLSSPDLDRAQDELMGIVAKLGPPFFHQNKRHAMPAQCHLGRVRPCLYTDGLIYPCDSVTLNSPGDNKKFHEDYAICKWNEVHQFFNNGTKGSLIDTQKCPHCVFTRQNNLLMDVINGKPLPPAPADTTHRNFV